MDNLFNPKMETLSRKKIRDFKKIRDLQLKRLKETVHLVYDTVPFYKRKFKELQIKPNDLKTLDDISKLPLTTKDDLRDNSPFGMMTTSLGSKG